MSTDLPNELCQSSPLSHGSSGAEWQAAHGAMKTKNALWSSLSFDGVQHDGRGSLVENRRCPSCGSTLSRSISPEQALEVCQRQAVLSALSAEAIADAVQVSARQSRGVVAMSSARHEETAAMSDRTSNQEWQAHQLTSEEARVAGRRDCKADVVRSASVGSHRPTSILSDNL
jgi:hypothetical protein